MDSSDNEKGQSALTLAAQGKSLNIAKLLIRHGAMLHHQDGAGYGLMHYAAMNNDVRMLDYALRLRQHTSVDIRGIEDGRTPAQLACSESHLDSLNLLLEHGASLHIKDKAGASALA